MRRTERAAVEFEELADDFSLRLAVRRACIGPNGRGCPENFSDPLLLDVAHIGGGGAAEREALK